jgi:hypothetical protein
MKTLDVRDSIKVENPDIIRFADDNGGFEACCLEKNDEGFELDSAYIKKEDFKNLLKALKIVKDLEWNKL